MLKNKKNGPPLIPGIIRLRDAPYYLGMNKTFFRDAVQPYLTRISIDKKGIGFSRIELDHWIAYTQGTLGQPPKSTPPWKMPNEAAPIQAPPTIQYRNSSRKITVRKKSLVGKPTARDLENLINRMVSSDNTSKKIK